MANGLVGVWSVTPSRRSSSSTVFDGVGAFDEAELTAMVISTTGMSTKNSTSPAKTPSIVRKNCFMERVGVRSRPGFGHRGP